jgi:hypothetical protein
VKCNKPDSAFRASLLIFHVALQKKPASTFLRHALKQVSHALTRAARPNFRKLGRAAQSDGF